jgi:cobalt-zinc-cadmium resistance protein CzcA
MFEQLIRFSIAQRMLVMFAALGIALVGLYSYQRLPIDAVPDITNVQVMINTYAPGYSPLEAEQRITFPVETVMAGLPGLQQTLSLSRYGLSQVTVIFDEGTDIYFARQQVTERLQQSMSQLPPGVDPTLGPIATGLGEIFMYTVDSAEGALKADGAFERPDEVIDLTDEPDHQELCAREQRFFHRAIAGNLDLADHMADAVNSLRIVLAADESFRSGRVVAL